MKKIENYGRTWRFTPKQCLTPTSGYEIARIVKGAGEVRVMGARHSWSRGIVTQDTLVSLDAMNRVISIDRDKLQVTVEAGIVLSDLIVALEAEGLALANLGSIADQTLAGAIATGTHGTGIGFKCLADQVESLSLIDGKGQPRTLHRDHPDFPAVVVGLGAFGIIHQMTLSVVPSFQMHAITETVPFDEVIDNLDGFVRGHDHFKMWWLVPNDEVIVFRQRRTDEPRNDSDFKRRFKDEFLAVMVYRGFLALQKLHRDKLVVATNRILGREYAKRFERICKSHVAFLAPSPPVHREGEWAFDYTDAPSLLREYRALMLGSGHTYNFIQEIRFTQGDGFWASPAYGRDTMWLSLYNIDNNQRWEDQRKKYEAFARAHGGRPHWGKEASFEPDYLRAHFPRLGDFAALRSTYDPDNTFANPWLRGIFGES